MTAEQFLQIVDILPEALLLLSADGTILAANHCAAERLGIAFAQLRDRPLGAWVETPPEALKQYLANCARTRQLIPGRLSWRVPDKRLLSLDCEAAAVQLPSPGAPAQVLLRLRPSGTGTRPLGTAPPSCDELGQRPMETELLVGEKRFQAILENSWEASVLLGADGVIRYASPSTPRILGYAQEEFVGRNALEGVHPDDFGRISALFAQLLQNPGARLSATYRYHHRDGSWRWLESTGTNLLEEPAVQAIVANNRDITEQREADRSKNQFLSMLAHELRNPLAPILTGLHVLRQAGSERQAREQTVNMLERQARHLSRLVDELLQVSHLQRGKIELRPELLDLARLVRTTVEDRRATLEQAGRTLTVATPEVPLWVWGDATRLVQVLQNLLENATKFTAPGGQILVRLQAEAEARQALLRVSDTGVGIEPELLPSVFDAFAPKDPSLDRSRGGLGLGLALVKGLVELHGGEVEAASAGPGQGAQFTVRLPLLEEPLALAQVPTKPTPAGERRRILVIEDNRDAADSLRLLLELLGHEVRVAYTGTQGVQAAAEWPPQVVLSDIGLPGGLNGYGVASELRRNPATAQAVLIALTGYGSDEDRRLARQSGFDRLLTKPADPDELQQLLVQPMAASVRDA